MGADPVPDLSLPQTKVATIDPKAGLSGVIQSAQDNLTVYNLGLRLRLLGGNVPHDELRGPGLTILSSDMSWSVEAQVGNGWAPLHPNGNSFNVHATSSLGSNVTRTMDVGSGQYSGELEITYTPTAAGLKWNLKFVPASPGHYRFSYRWHDVTAPSSLSPNLQRFNVDYGYSLNYTFSWSDVPSVYNSTASILGNRFELLIDLGNMISGSVALVDPTIASSTSSSATSWPFQRKVFFEPTGGYYFAFYYDGISSGWSSSKDGVNWSPKGAMPSGWPGYWDSSISGPTVLNFGQTVIIASGNYASGGCSGNCGISLTVYAYWAQGTISGGQITWQPDSTGAYARIVTYGVEPCNSNGGSCTVNLGYRYVNMAVSSDGNLAFSYNFFWERVEYDFCGGSPYSASGVYAQYKTQTFGPSGLYGCGRYDLSNQDWSMVLAADPAAGMRMVYYYTGSASSPSLLSVWFNGASTTPVETVEGTVQNSPSFSGVSDSAYGNHIIYLMSDGTMKSAERQTRDTSWTKYSTDVFSSAAAVYPSITIDGSNDDLFALAATAQSIVLRSKSLTGAWYDRQLTVPISRPTNIAYLTTSLTAVGSTNSSWITAIWTEGSSSPYTVMFGAIPIPTVWSPFASSNSPWDGNGLVPFGQYFTNLGESVSPSTGMLTVKQTDLSVPGRGLDLSITRVYTEPPSFLGGNPNNVETLYGFRDDSFTAGWNQYGIGTFSSDGDIATITETPASTNPPVIVKNVNIDTSKYPYLVWRLMGSTQFQVGVQVGGTEYKYSYPPDPAVPTSWTTMYWNVGASTGGAVISQVKLWAVGTQGSYVKYDYVAAANGLIGNGWQFNFPWMTYVSQPSYLHLWDGQGYRIPVSFWSGLSATFENHQGTSFRLVRSQDGTITLSTSSGTTYHFDTGHRLTTIADATGNNTIAFNYDSSNRISNIMDTLQRVYLFCYDSNLPMELRTIYQTTSTGTCSGAGSTRSIQYSYDTNLGLASVTDAGGRVTNFAYNFPVRVISPWLPTQITYPTQWASTYSYIGLNLGLEDTLYTYRVFTQNVVPVSGPPVRSTVYTYTKGAGDQVIGSSVLTYNGTSSSGAGSGPLAIDGSAIIGCSHSTMLCSVALTTSKPNDIIIAFTTEGLDLATSCTFGVSDTAGLSWTARSGVVFGRGNRDQLQEWWAPSAGVLSSDLITESISGCNSFNGGEYNGVLVFAISGTNFGNPFDPNAGVPGAGSGNGYGTSASISTSNPGDMIIAGMQHGSSPVPTAQSGFSIISSCGGCATEYEVASSTLTNFAVTFGDTASDAWEEIADAIQPAQLPLVSDTDYAFSYAGMTKNVSDANHRLISGVQQRFGIHGEVIRETNLVTSSNVWYWTKNQPGSGWNAQLNWPLSAWSLAPVVQNYGGSPWGTTAGWQDTTANWIWWNPDAATSSTLDTVWFRTIFTVPVSTTVNIEVRTDDSFTLYLDGNQYLTGNNWQVRYTSTGIPLQSGSHVIAVIAGNIGGPAGLLLSVSDANTNQVIDRTDTSIGSYTNSYRYDLWGNLIYSHLAINPSSNSYQDNFYSYYNDGTPLGYYYFIDTFSDSEGNRADNPEWSKDFVMPDRTPDPCCTVRMNRDNMGVVDGRMHFDVDGYPVSFYFYSPQIPISGSPPHWLVSFDWIANSTTSASSVTNMDLQIKFSNGTRVFVSQLVAGGSLGASGSYSKDLGGMINDAIAHGNTWAKLVWHIEDAWDADWQETGDIANVRVSPGASFSNSFMNGFAPGPPGLNTWLYTKSPPSTGWNYVTNWSPAGGWTLAPAVQNYNGPPWGTISGFVDTSTQWIWWNKGAWSTSTQDPVWFRRVFNVPSTLSMNIEMTADNAYWLYLDGNFIDSNAAWTTRKTYGSFVLTPGLHVLAVEAVNFGCCNPAGLLLSASNAATGQILFHTDGVAGPNIVTLAGEASFQGGSIPLESYVGYTTWGAMSQTQRRLDTTSGLEWVTSLSTYDGLFGHLKTYSDPMGNIAYYTYSAQGAFLTNVTQGLTPALFSDFNNGTYAGWTVSSGSWTVPNGELSSSGTGDEDISAGQTSWTLNLVQSRVKILSGQDVSIDFLWDGGGNHYRMQTWDGYQTLHLYRSQAGVYTELANSPLSGIIGSQWHTWRIAVSGGTIRLYIDGIQYIQYTDPSPYTTGKVRLRALNTQVHYDDVLVGAGKGAVTKLFSYDAPTGRILTATDPTGNVTSYEYDILGRTTKMFYPNVTASPNLLVNPGFETGDFSGWTQTGMIIRANDQHSGQFSAAPSYNSVTGIYSAYTLQQNLPSPVLGNLVSKIQFWYRYGTGDYAQVLYSDGTFTQTSLPFVSSWTLMTLSVTNSKQVVGLKIFRTSGQTNNIYLDDFVVSRISSGGDFAAYAYNDAANFVDTTNENGWKTRQIYDGLGRLIINDRFSGTTSFTNSTYSYDGSNNIVAKTDVFGRAYTSSYDAVGRPIRDTAPDSNYTQQAYDGLHNWVQFTDQKGNRQCSIYDRLGRLISVIQEASALCQNGIATNYNYDAAGNLIQSTNADSQLTRHTYDALNRLVVNTFPDGSTESYVYDNDGNLIRKVSQQALLTLYSYDTLNRLTNTTHCGTRISSDNYAYDKDGRTITMASLNATISYTYDSRSRPTSESYSVNSPSQPYNPGCPTGTIATTTGTTQTYTASYSYKGETLGQVVYPDSVKANYTYDAMGRLASVFTPGGTTYATLSYNKDDSIRGVGFGNGAVANYTYDILSRMSTLTLKKSSGTVIMSLAYSYDKIGLLINTNGQVNSVNTAQTYAYDAIGRLTNATLADSGSSTNLWYEYDNLGNRLVQSQNGVITNYSYNMTNNELKSYSSGSSSASYTYDPIGNLATRIIGATTWTYTWDGSNHLTKAVANGATSGAYAYDASGRRVEAIESSSTTFYAYLGTETLYETSSGNPTDHIFAGGVRISTVSGRTVSYHHQDGLGNTRLITDSSNKQNVIFADNYQPFGQDSGTPTGSAIYKFAGKPYSTVIGFYYFFQRWYDASIGRFLSPDPFLGHLSSPLSLNRYLFVSDSPFASPDPSGLDCSWNPTSWLGCIYDNTVGTAIDTYNWYQSASDSDRRAFWIGIAVAVGIGLVVGLSCIVAACAGLVLLGIGLLTSVAGSIWAADAYRLAGGTSPGGEKASLFWGGLASGLAFSGGLGLGDALDLGGAAGPDLGLGASQADTSSITSDTIDLPQALQRSDLEGLSQGSRVAANRLEDIKNAWVGPEGQLKPTELGWRYFSEEDNTIYQVRLDNAAHYGWLNPHYHLEKYVFGQIVQKIHFYLV